MTGVPKIAVKDTSIVASNIRGEKKAIPILKGTSILINIVGTHYNRTYLVFSRCLVHILMMKLNVLPYKIPFQLVTGLTRMHSTLHGFSKIGLVMLFCRSVPVRNSSFFFQNLPFFTIKYAGARACLGRKYVDLTPFPSKHFQKNAISFSFSFFFTGRFAESESIAALAMLVSHYKFTIKVEPKFAGETFEERKSRILSLRQVLTLTYVLKKPLYFMSGLIKMNIFFFRPVRIPITFTRR